MEKTANASCYTQSLVDYIIAKCG